MHDISSLTHGFSNSKAMCWFLQYEDGFSVTFYTICFLDKKTWGKTTTFYALNVYQDVCYQLKLEQNHIYTKKKQQLMLPSILYALFQPEIYLQNEVKQYSDSFIFRNIKC